MLVIGLTGGIGSGKTTVANLFAKLGIPIIDTDQLAREVVAPNTNALKKIITHFGKQILTDQNELDRKKLGQIVFKSKSEKQWLENLLHPLIREKTKQALQQVHSPYCIVVIPLLVEAKPNPLIQRVLVVDATQAQRIQRVRQRDHLTQQQVLNIIRSQASRSKRLKIADDIIKNNFDEKDLQKQVKKLHQHYLKIAK